MRRNEKPIGSEMNKQVTVELVVMVRRGADENEIARHIAHEADRIARAVGSGYGPQKAGTVTTRITHTENIGY